MYYNILSYKTQADVIINNPFSRRAVLIKQLPLPRKYDPFGSPCYIISFAGGNRIVRGTRARALRKRKRLANRATNARSIIHIFRSFRYDHL